jgi:hypothetical protein
MKRITIILLITTFFLFSAFAQEQEPTPAKTKPSQAPAKKHSPAKTTEAKPSEAKEEILDNNAIIALVSAGLPEDVIIEKIRTTKSNFDLTANGLVQLSQAKVSPRIIKVMMNPTAPETQASPASTLVKLPKEPGVYWFNEEALVKLDLRTLAQAKVGGRLGHVVTLGIKSVKNKAYLLGHSAKLKIKQNQPIFYIYVPDGATVDEFVLVEMDQKSDRRELEVGSVGGIVGAKQGLRFEKIRPTESELITERVFKVVPRSPLARGEYLFYIVGSADSIKGILGKGYDFAIE